MFGFEQDQRLCCCYHYIMSAEFPGQRLLSSGHCLFLGFCPCILKMVTILGVATKKYILTLFLMFFFQSLDCTAMYPHIQIFRSGCICYLKFSSWRKRFLSASFEQENCQSSIHQIKDFASFVSGSVTWEERFARSISMQLPGRQRFFKAGPGDQIMTNEVQVNVTGGGSWWETGPI